MEEFVVDWESRESHLLVNPQLPAAEIQAAHELMLASPEMMAHVWVATSGSTRQPGDSLKWVLLSKEALLASASAVNAHLQVGANDRWLLALPTFHVGGLGVLARAHLSGVEVIHLLAWDPKSFCEQLAEARATLSALVPTQVFDLVQMNLPCPQTMRAIVIGGSALSESLYAQARALGWPLLPSFGMSECGSQVATAELVSLEVREFPQLRLLSHIKASTDAERFLGVAGPSLFTRYAQQIAGQNQYWDPKQDGVFWSEDRAALDYPYLTPLGRSQDFIKIAGENVSLSDLNQLFAQLAPDLSMSSVILARPDERLGARVIWVTEGNCSVAREEEIRTAFLGHVLPVARIAEVHRLPRLPRSPLGKILREEILAKITGKHL